MDIIIRNKWISLGGSSQVLDTNENDLLKVKGRIFTFTSKKFVNDLNGNLLYIVRRKFWRLFIHKAFIIDNQNNIVATVRRKFISLHDRYFIEDCNKGHFEITGNILQYNYSIIKDGVEIGHIARRISLRDSFVLTIPDEYKDDFPFYVALVIAIDNITDHRDSGSS